MPLAVLIPQVVNEVLRDLNSDPKCRDNFVVVQLSGLVHVNDHQALLGIAAQLDLKDEIEDCVTVRDIFSVGHG